jgi:hypothetical protein
MLSFVRQRDCPDAPHGLVRGQSVCMPGGIGLHPPPPKTSPQPDQHRGRMATNINRGVSGPIPPDPLSSRVLAEHPAIQLLLRQLDGPGVVKPKPKPARPHRGRVFNDESRGQRLLAVMAEEGCGHYTAARRACLEDPAGASPEACEKRLARWFKAHKTARTLSD